MNSNSGTNVPESDRLGVADRERPDPSTPLRAFAGTIHADPDEVFASIAARVAPTEGFFLADPVDRLAVVQGGWWYRAEYRVLPDSEGSRVEFEIVNVATAAHWLGPITGRAVLRASASTFRDLLTALADELE